LWSDFVAETFTPSYAMAPDLRVIRHRGRCILVNPDTGGWAVAAPAELAALSHPRQLPRSAAEAAYEYGLALRNGGRATAPPFPDSLPLRVFEFNLGLECNLRCTYCLNDARPGGAATRIEPAVVGAFVHRVLDHAAVHRLDWVAVEFVGGEPFLQFPVIRRTMERFASLAPASLRLTYRIQNNFTALRPEHLRFMAGHEVHLGLSLDGDRGAHDRHRRFAAGGGSHRTVMTNLERARRAGFPVHAAYGVVTSDTVDRLDELARFYLRHELYSLSLDPVRPTGRARALPDLEPDPAVYVRRLLEVFEAVFIPHWRETGTMPTERRLAMAFAYLLEPARRYMCHMAPCGAGWLINVTMPDGSVYPCNEHPWPDDYRLGSVLEDSFDAMIDSAPARLLRTRTPERIAECRDCLYRGWCQSQCSHGALVNHGRLLAPSMYCRLMRELFHQCLLALAEERFDREAVLAQARGALDNV